jgi:hypothetical protein
MQFTHPGLFLTSALLMLPARHAGQPPSFAMVPIRPAAAANAGTSVELVEGGRLRIANEPAKLLLRIAFQMQDAQIARGPAWLDTDRFDVAAKTGRPEKITREQRKHAGQAARTALPGVTELTIPHSCPGGALSV